MRISRSPHGRVTLTKTNRAFPSTLHTVRLLRQRVALGNAETQKRQNTNLLSTSANNSESRWSFARTRIDAKVTADGFRTAELIPAHRLITFPEPLLAPGIITSGEKTAFPPPFARSFSKDPGVSGNAPPPPRRLGEDERAAVAYPPLAKGEYR